jgi:hypothetical protein
MFSKTKYVRNKLSTRYFNTKIKSKIRETPIEEKVEQEFETFDKLPHDKKKDFYQDYRDSIMTIESGRKLRYWYILHSLPIIFFPNYLSYLWIYQIFWSGTVAGLGMVCYDLYSDKKEKGALDLHIIGR